MTTQIIQTEGASIHITDDGLEKPTFIFLHYWGGSSRTWQPVIDRLNDRVRCIALNQRGWGDSVVTDVIISMRLLMT